jgi:hypothetical protein
MTTPPPVPPVQPPPLPKNKRLVPTLVYCVFFLLLLCVNGLLAYGQAVSKFPHNPAARLGYLQGGLVVPLVAIAAIAAIWKQNRGFRGVVRVLFWASLFMVFVKLSQFANSLQSLPNKSTASSAHAAG